MFFTFAAVEAKGCRPFIKEVNVPGDYTLKKAVDKVESYNSMDKFFIGNDKFTTIVLGKGVHVVEVYKTMNEFESVYDDNTLKIASAMRIVGDPKVAREEIVIVGGIEFKEGIQGNCHLQHLTIRQATNNGVYGFSSFTMEDVLVEQCDDSGVVASGTDVVGRCTNVEVKECGRNGVAVYRGATITLIGPNTDVHHNNAKKSAEPGLKALTGTIQLISPLTQDTVSHDHGRGLDYKARSYSGGYIREIKTEPPPPYKKR